MTGADRTDDSEHFDMIKILRTRLESFSGEFNCRTPGIEVLLPPYPAQEILFEGKQVKIDPTSAMIFNGWVGHQERFRSAVCPIASVKISAGYLNKATAGDIRIDSLVFDRPFIPNDLEITREILTLVSLLRTSEPTRLTADCLMTHILIRLFTELQNTHSEQFRKKMSTGYFPDQISRIKGIIVDHLFDPAFDLDCLAKTAGLSKFHLIRIFKKATGMSPAAYSRQLKADYAKGSLLRDGRSIISIATELGYRDLSTFNKSFKKLTSQTPSSFRKASKTATSSGNRKGPRHMPGEGGRA